VSAPLTTEQVEYLRELEPKWLGASYDASSIQRSLIARGLARVLDSFLGTCMITDLGRAYLASLDGGK
jgi:hypothetical protein